MAQAKSNWSDDWLWIFDAKVDIGHLNDAERKILESELDSVLSRRHDVVDYFTDFKGDKLEVYAETTEDIWDDVQFVLKRAEVEWDDYDQRYLPAEEPDYESAWYTA